MNNRGSRPLRSKYFNALSHTAHHAGLTWTRIHTHKHKHTHIHIPHTHTHRPCALRWTIPLHPAPVSRGKTGKLAERTPTDSRRDALIAVRVAVGPTQGATSPDGAPTSPPHPLPSRYRLSYWSLAGSYLRSFSDPPSLRARPAYP